MVRKISTASLLTIPFMLSGCNLVHELKDDPAIVGITGFNLVLGVDPAINSPFPAPKVHMNWGTMFRIGPHDCVYASTAGGARAYMNGAEKPTTSGNDNNGTTPTQQATQEAVPKVATDKNDLKQKEAALATNNTESNSDAASPVNELADKKTVATNAMLASSATPTNNSCVPTTHFSSTPNGNFGEGAQAHLTISANGLGALKKRWELQARLDEVLNNLSEGTIKDMSSSNDKADNFVKVLKALHDLADDSQHDRNIK